MPNTLTSPSFPNGHDAPNVIQMRSCPEDYHSFDHRAPLDNTRPCDVGDYEVDTFNDPKPAPSCDAQRKNATRQVIAGWVGVALVICIVLTVANALVGLIQ